MKMNSSKISVIIPLKNEGNSIGSLLRNLANCSLRMAEIILIDAGSTDDTCTKIDELIKTKYLNLNLVLLKENSLFAGAARNIGAARAKNEWLLFLDAGTEIDDDYLDEVFKIIDENNSLYTIGSIKFDYRNNISRALVELCYKGGNSFCCLPGTLITAGLYKKTGGFLKNIRAFEDAEFLARLKKEKTYLYQERKESLTYNHLPDNYLEIFNKWFEYQCYIFQSKIFLNKAIFYVSIIPILIILGIMAPFLVCFFLLILLILRLVPSTYRNVKAVSNIKTPLNIRIYTIVKIILIIEVAKIQGSYVSLFYFLIKGLHSLEEKKRY